MTFDIPHMLATAAIIFLVLFGLGQLTFFKNLSKGRRITLSFVVLFAVLLVLNIAWPENV